MSGDTTQKPSAMQSRAGTPPTGASEVAQTLARAVANDAMHPPHAALNDGMMQPPAGLENAIVKAYNIDDVKKSGNFIFNLKIIAAKLVQINYDPKKAEGNLNAQLQDAVATISRVPDMPANLFHVAYVPPPPPETYGMYTCHVPAAFTEMATSPAFLAILTHTGDDDGNNYKLEYAAHVARTNKSKRPKNDTYWFHLDPSDEAMKRPIRELYEKTNVHITKFGMSIQEHDKAFVPKLTANKEQRDGNKIHVEYDLNPALVPRDEYGRMCIIGLKNIDFDPEVPGCDGTLWFRPDLLERIFGACKVCHKHLQVCIGHEPKPPQNKAEGKRPIAEEAAANAKRRMAAKAAKAKTGGFSFDD